MSSFFQYRRLRQQVQDDLAQAEQPKRTKSQTPSSTTSDPKKEDEKVLQPEDIARVPGVTVSRPEEGDGSVVFEVGFKENDPSNPLNWSLAKKWTAMLTCCALAIPLTMLASIEGPVQEAFDAHFHVNAEAGSMTTGIVLKPSRTNEKCVC